MAELFRDRVFAILASGIDAVAVVVQLSAGQGARFGAIPGGDFIRGALINSSGQIELVKITAVAVDQLTIIRQYDGSTALSFVAGDRIECRIGPSSLANFAQVAHLQTNEKTFGVNTGTADDLIVTLPSALLILSNGMEVDVELTGANTGGPARLKVILGAVDTGFLPIVKGASGSAGTPIAAGDLPGANSQAEFRYDASLNSWVLLNPAEQAIPVLNKSVNYTATLADANSIIKHPASDNFARTFTIPSNAAVPYLLGTVLEFPNEINVLSVAIDVDTLTLMGAGTNGTRTVAAKGMLTAVKMTPTSWFCGGPGVS